MKNYSCEITVRHRDLELFDLTKFSGRSDRNDFLSLAIDASLKSKYTSFQLAPLYRSLSPAAFATGFTLVRTVQVDSETSKMTYAYKLPPTSRTIVRPFQQGRDSEISTPNHLVTTMVASSPLDARSGPALRTIRRRRGTPAASINGPVGVQPGERIRVVCETVWED
jgi:hypothetical protein